MKKVPYLNIKHTTAEDDLSLLRWGKASSGWSLLCRPRERSSPERGWMDPVAYCCVEVSSEYESPVIIWPSRLMKYSLKFLAETQRT